jgi:uncharacterized membrane protein (UPF0127 family)
VAHFLVPLLREPGQVWAVRNQRTGRIAVSRLEPAFDSASRRRGLLGRDGLPGGAAMVLAPCRAVHTWFMRFPIDLVFVARDGRVVKVCEAVGPWRVRIALGGFAVIELNAGTAAHGFRPGDLVELVGAPSLDQVPR